MLSEHDLKSLRCLVHESRFRTVPGFSMVHVPGAQLLELLDEVREARQLRQTARAVLERLSSSPDDEKPGLLTDALLALLEPHEEVEP